MVKRATQRDTAREPQLKAAVIDALFQHEWVDDDAVIISEMPLPHGDRRADLVLANGKLIGFEIKSSADTTTRLAAQAAAFLDQFEGLVVVVDERHYIEAEKLLPLAAGIFTSREVDGRVEISIRRKVHIRALDRAASLRLMHVADLQKLARSNSVTVSSASRYGLEQALVGLPQSAVRKAALDSVKRRYRPYFNAYREHRSQSVAIGDGLELLRKPAWQSVGTRAAPEKEINAPAASAVVAGPLHVIPRLITRTRRPPA